MAGIPVNFRKQQPQDVVTYDYFDLAEGTGITKFYLFAMAESVAGTTYHLTSSIPYSVVIGKVGANDDTYSLTAFNMPKTIKGTGIIQIPWLLNKDAGATTLTFTCTLKKNTDTIASVVQSVTVNGTNTNERIWTMPIVIPQTHFKKGDVLRLNVVAALSAGGDFSYAIDPKNRAYVYKTRTFVYTDANILIPFKIRL